MLEFLPAAGMRAARPLASLYVWAEVPAGEKSAAFSARVLERTGVWLTPGTAFGAHGEGYVRIAGERLRRL